MAPALVAQPATSDWLSVRGGGTCLRQPALMRHTQRYLAGRRPTGQVSIAVEVAAAGAVTLRVRTADRRARRHFAKLPRGCGDRLRALGLAMALAIESVGAGQVVESLSSRSESSVNGAPEPAGTPAPTTAPADPLGEPSRAAAAPAQDVGPTDRTEPADDPLTETPAGRPEPEGADRAAARREGDNPEGTDAAPRSPAPTPANGTGAAINGPPRWSLWAGGGLVTGAKPTTTFVAMLGADLPLGSLGLELGAVWSPGTEVRIPGAGRAETALYGGRAGACLGGTVSLLRAEGCLGLLGGALVAEGIDVSGGQRATVGWLASSLGLRLRVPATTRVGLRFRLDFLQNLVQPGLVVAGDGGGSVFAGDFGVSGFAGLEIAFW